VTLASSTTLCIQRIVTASFAGFLRAKNGSNKTPQGNHHTQLWYSMCGPDQYDSVSKRMDRHRQQQQVRGSSSIGPQKRSSPSVEHSTQLCGGLGLTQSTPLATHWATVMVELHVTKNKERITKILPSTTLVELVGQATRLCSTKGDQVEEYTI
jgi:hypothetical protein